MKHQRNVNGLKQNAQKKRQAAIERTEAGIRQLIKEGRSVNFKTVSEVADVSTAWLYREPDIKARIEQLRSQGTSKPQASSRTRASDASKAAVNQALKDRIRRLEAENRGLREHIEVLQGQVLELPILKRKVETLTSENAKLKSQIPKQLPKTSGSSEQIRTSDHSSLKKPTQLSPEVRTELESLGVKLNISLIREIELVNEEIIQNAIAALQQRQSIGTVENPAGFLRTAIRERWSPNLASPKSYEMMLFQEWYRLASIFGIAKASQNLEGVLHVYTSDEQWIPFKEICAQYPLDTLQAELDRQND